VKAAKNRYALFTQWRLETPIERVRDASYAVEAWPRWWK
jgi:hypothetical protein